MGGRTNWELSQRSERWSSEGMPRETGDLHCRGYLEHPLGGPSSTHLEASTEQVLSPDLTEKPSLKGLPRETGGLRCRGYIEHPLGGPGSTRLEAKSLEAVNQRDRHLELSLPRREMLGTRMLRSMNWREKGGGGENESCREGLYERPWGRCYGEGRVSL
jgi:hypothetical protein